MQQRMVEFIRALRAVGVRISLAESQDAMFGVDAAGVEQRQHFQKHAQSRARQRPASPARLSIISSRSFSPTTSRRWRTS